MHIFKDVTLTSKSYIIKALSNSDSAVVWVDIWNSQNSSIAKFIINSCFNVGKYNATIHGTNMNLGVSQYKSCQKQGHSMLTCQLYTSRCSKCYRSYNTKHHREKVWCCKENMNSKPPKRKVSLVFISSNVSTVKRTIKWTVPAVLINKTISTESSIVKSGRSFTKDRVQ